MDEVFVLQNISCDFVDVALKKVRSNRATAWFDGLTARLLKTAGSTIAKPIAHIINLYISKRIIPYNWKAAKVTPIQGRMRITIDQSRYFPSSPRSWSEQSQVKLLSFITDNKILSIKTNRASEGNT